MKKFILAVLAFVLCAAAFVACDSGSGSEGTERKITFEQAGYDAVVKYVEDGEDLTDIPDPVQKPGYTVTWSIQNFENITEDLTVTAIEKANEYKIFYDAGEGTVAQPHTDVTFDAPYELLTPVYPGYTFTGWVITESGEAFASGEKYSVVGDVYLTATWEANDDYVNPFL